MRTFWQDLRFGLRFVWGNPGFTAVAVLTLAIGIAAITTAFSWIDNLLLNPFPGSSDAGRLAVLESTSIHTPDREIQTSYQEYRVYRDHLKLIAGLAVHTQDVFGLGEPGSVQPVWGELVSGNYFAVLGVRPVLGRVFAPYEYGDVPGSNPVAVISYRLWRARFHADPGVIGKKVRVNRHDLTMVGVAPPEFRGTEPGLLCEIWIPAGMGTELGNYDAASLQRSAARNFRVVARLKDGVTIEQARAEAASVARGIEAISPDSNHGIGATILAPREMHTGAPRLLLGPLRILMAVSLLVLLIACANVANLLLARSVTRNREFGIRIALGAGRFRLLRQLLTETLILAGAGAAAALPLADLMARSLPLLVPNVGAPVDVAFHLSGRTLAFTILTCVAAALICGAAPVVFSFRTDISEVLKQAGRSGHGGAHSHRTRAFLVISEVALAAVALIGAGLFVKSFQNARNIYPGFDRTNVLLARFYFRSIGYSFEDVQQFCLRLREGLRSAPGIRDVNYADYAPLGSSGGPFTEARPEGYVPAHGERMDVGCTMVAPGYFSLLRIPLPGGRDFSERDDRNAAPVVIVNEAFARRYFGGSSPVGRRIRCWGAWRTVVGMAGDTRYYDPVAPPEPHLYVPLRQRYAGNDIYFFIRTAADPVQAEGLVRREIAAVDPNVGAYHAMPLVEFTNVTLLPQKIAASLLAGLGIISLLLAGTGLYSIMAYAVSQRTQEIGIRMALGAQPRDVFADVLRRGMALTAAGLAAGIAVALVAARVVSGLFVHVGAADPVIYAAAVLFLAGVALLAGYLPARRATRVDPAVALRYQ